MSVNRAEHSLEDSLVNRIRSLETDMRELKTRQLVGADVIQVQTIPSVGYTAAGPLNIPAGNFGSFVIANQSNLIRLSQWDFEASVMIDANDPVTNVMPGGSALTTNQLKVERSDWIDWSRSNDSINLRTYVIRLHNVDTVAHDYYIAFKAYLPKAGGGSLVTPGLGGGV